MPPFQEIMTVLKDFPTMICFLLFVALAVAAPTLVFGFFTIAGSIIKVVQSMDDNNNELTINGTVSAGDAVAPSTAAIVYEQPALPIRREFRHANGRLRGSPWDAPPKVRKDRGRRRPPKRWDHLTGAPTERPVIIRPQFAFLAPSGGPFVSSAPLEWQQPVKTAPATDSQLIDTVSSFFDKPETTAAPVPTTSSRLPATKSILKRPEDKKDDDFCSHERIVTWGPDTFQEPPRYNWLADMRPSYNHEARERTAKHFTATLAAIHDGTITGFDFEFYHR